MVFNIIANDMTTKPLQQSLRPRQPWGAWVFVILTVLALSGEGLVTRARNKVWRTEESLWTDTVAKSPHNGRAWMNLGVAKMAKGEFQEAETCFQLARIWAPSYSLVYVNLGILYSAESRGEEAERNFQEALRLAPDDPQSHSFYESWKKRRVK